MKPETKGTMSYEDRRRFAVGVLKGIAAPVTAGNVEFLLAWMSRENTAAKNNPLATTFPSDGWTAFNYQKKDGKFVLDRNGDRIPLVKNYPSFDEGVRSTVVSLLGYSEGELGVHDYSAVVEELRSGTTPEQVLSNPRAVEQIGTWGSFKSRDGFGAEDTWGFTLEELEALPPGELEALNTTTLRPIPGYEFPDPTTSIAVEKSGSPEGADVEQWPDIQSGRDTLNEFGEKDLGEGESRALRSALGLPGGDEYSGPIQSDHDPRMMERIERGIGPDETLLGEEQSSELQQTLAWSAFEELSERLKTEQDPGVREQLLIRLQEVAQEIILEREKLNEFGEIEMGEAESALFKESLEGATGPMVLDYYIDEDTGEKVYFESISWDEETSNAFLEALGTGEIDPETEDLIRETFGSMTFFEQNTPEFMIDTDGDGEGDQNIIDWIAANPNKTDGQILNALRSVPWFRENGPTARQFDLDYFKEGDAGKDALIETQRDLILQEARQIGFNWLIDNPDLLNDLAYEASRFGWSDIDRKRALAGLNTFEASELKRGKILANRQTVLDTAARYYVPVGEKAANDIAWSIYKGEETTGSMEAMYREQAKGMFPTLSGLIDQGVSPQAYFSPYKEKIGQLLERPGDSIDLMNDPRFQAIMFPEAGQGPLSLYQTQRYIRQLPEWRYTKNADEAARRMVNNIGKMMGVVAR